MSLLKTTIKNKEYKPLYIRIAIDAQQHPPWLYRFLLLQHSQSSSSFLIIDIRSRRLMCWERYDHVAKYAVIAPDLIIKGSLNRVLVYDKRVDEESKWHCVRLAQQDGRSSRVASHGVTAVG